MTTKTWMAMTLALLRENSGTEGRFAQPRRGCQEDQGRGTRPLQARQVTVKSEGWARGGIAAG